MIELAVRIIFSLLVVLGLMWLLARLARRPLAGRSGGLLGVIARQQLTRGASVAVLRVGDRALVLGITDQHVTLLAETEPVDPDGPARGGGELREPLTIAELTHSGGQPVETAALSGSILSPATWKQAVAALRRGRGG
jgi:flagellar protein FliO/FliZ